MIWIYLVFTFVTVTAAQQFGECRVLFAVDCYCKYVLHSEVYTMHSDNEAVNDAALSARKH